MDALILKSGRSQRLRAGHPWVYRTDAASVPAVTPAETVPFQDQAGEILAWGYVNPLSAIPGRAIHFGKNPPPDDWLSRRIAAAAALRVRANGGTAHRLIFSEGDGLPGLIVDRYDDLCVATETTAGMEARREEWLAALRTQINPARIYLRNEAPVRTIEGLARESRWLLGDAGGETKVALSGVEFAVDPAGGHKTGLYLDQRENYATLARWIKPGDAVADLYCHQGGFALTALRAGATRAVGVESSIAAMAGARGNAARNQLQGFEPVEMDVALWLKSAPANAFNVVILDPPPLVKTPRDLVRAYPKFLDLHARAMALVAPGGLLFTFACSEALGWEELQKLIRAGAKRAGRRALLLQRLGQPADHPVPANFPEAEYLRGFVVGVE